jgi:RimJ/RimL family protein N-acetyltransferase
MRDDLVKIMYDSVKDRIQVSYDIFAKLMLDWDFIPLKEHNAVIGVVAAKNNELHIGYKTKPTASIRGHLRKTLKETISKYGCATTAVVKGNEKSLAFCKRLGFTVEAENNGIIRMRCDRSKYV